MGEKPEARFTHKGQEWDARWSGNGPGAQMRTAGVVSKVDVSRNERSRGCRYRQS